MYRLFVLARKANGSPASGGVVIVTNLLSRLRDKNGAAWQGFTQDERRAVRRSLEDLAGKRDLRGLAFEVNRHALSARSLLLQLDLAEARGFWNVARTRDRGMARMVEEVLGVGPRRRATLWAHLGHLAREYIVGAPTLGAHLASTLGGRYRVYALLAYAGSARARDRKKELGVIEHSFAKAPPYTLEGALAQTEPGLLEDVTYWTLGDTAARSAHWLQELHLVRSFGATYPGEQESFEIYDLRSFDGAVLFGNVAPSEPVAGTLTPSSPSP